jgi:hypothetical protein
MQGKPIITISKELLIQNFMRNPIRIILTPTRSRFKSKTIYQRNSVDFSTDGVI